MSADENRRYNISARLAAFRNVVVHGERIRLHAQEHPDGTVDELFQTVERCDRGHLRSIHQALQDYDYTKPWVTHASIQKWDIHQTRPDSRYSKPVVNDEPEYRGHRTPGGNISAQYGAPLGTSS